MIAGGAAYRRTRPRGTATRRTVAALVLAAVAFGGLASYDPVLAVAGAIAVVFLTLLVTSLPLAMAGWIVVTYLSGLPGLIGAPAITTFLVGGAWLLTMDARREQLTALRARAPAALYVPAVLFAWMLLSGLWATDLAVAGSQLWLFFTGLVTVPIVATAVDRARTAHVLVAAYVGGAALIVLLAIVLGPDSYIDAATDTTGRLQVANFSANLLGATSATALVLVPAVLGASRRPLLRMAAAVAGGLLAYGLVATQSRSGFIALAVAALVALAVCRGRRRRVLGMIALGLVLLGAFVAVNPAVLDRVSQGDSTGTGRTELWAAATNMFADHPVLGVGVGNFPVRAKDYALDIGPVTYVRVLVDEPLPPHNFVLEALAETGVIGLALLLAALGACVAATVRAMRAFRRLGDDRLELLAQLVLVAQSAIITAGLFLPITYSRQMWILLALGPALYGIALTTRRRADDGPSPSPASPSVAPSGPGSWVAASPRTAPPALASWPGPPALAARPAPPALATRAAGPRPASPPDADRGSEDPLPRAEPSASGSDDAPEASFKRGVGWSLFALVASKAVSFVALLVLARILVPDEFGIVAAVTMYLAFLEIVSDLGVKAVVVYEQERGHSERVQTAFTLNLMVVGVATVVGLLVAVPASHFFGAEDHRALFLLCVLSLTCTGVSNIHDGLLLRELSLARRVRPQLARGVVQAIVSIALALAGLGATAVVVGVVCGSLAWTVVQWRMTTFRPTFTFERSIARSMVAYAAGAWMFFVTSWVSIQADVLVVGNQLDTHDLGVYSMAYRLPELLVFNVAWMLSTVAFPALARERAKDDADVAGATVGIIHYLALYALPMAAGLAVLAPAIVTVLFSSTWAASAPVLSGVAIAVAMVTTFTPVADAAKAVGRQWAMVGLYLLHIPMVVAAVVYADRWGPEGVAWAGVLATIVFLAMLLTWTHRALGITVGTLAVALRGPVAAALGVVVLTAPVRWFLLGSVPDLVVLVVGGVAGVAGALLAVRVLSPGTLADVSEQLGVGRVLTRLRPSRARTA